MSEPIWRASGSRRLPSHPAAISYLPRVIKSPSHEVHDSVTRSSKERDIALGSVGVSSASRVRHAVTDRPGREMLFSLAPVPEFALLSVGAVLAGAAHDRCKKITRARRSRGTSRPASVRRRRPRPRHTRVQGQVDDLGVTPSGAGRGVRAVRSRVGEVVLTRAPRPRPHDPGISSYSRSASIWRDLMDSNPRPNDDDVAERALLQRRSAGRRS